MIDSKDSASAHQDLAADVIRLLAEWTWNHLVNRTDVHGQYLPLDKRKELRTTCITSSMWPLDIAKVRSHYRGRQPGHIRGLHPTGLDGKCRWVAVDIDAHGDDPQSVRDANRLAALAWHDVLVGLGFHPLLIDSNGRGGFHLWVIFSEPIPEAVAFRFLEWLTRDAPERGVKEFDLRPAQSKRGGKKCGNWLRLPGKHHSSDHWSRAWGADGWLSWPATAEFMLQLRGDDPRLLPIEITALKTPNASKNTTAYQEDTGRNRRSLCLLLSPHRNYGEVLGVETAIGLTLPTGPGQRHRLIFDLVRILKSLPQFFDAHPRELKPVVEEWHRRALPFIATKDFGTTWDDAVYAWDNMRVPYGETALGRTAEEARVSVPDPADWRSVLAEVCRRLAAQHAGVFWLSQKGAAAVLGVDQSQISRCLRSMEVDGLVERITRGHTGRASEYRWTRIESKGHDHEAENAAEVEATAGENALGT